MSATKKPQAPAKKTATPAAAKKSVAAPAAAKKTAKKSVATTSDTKAKPALGEAPIVSFPDARAFSTWLAAQHASSRGVWLRLAKKDSGVASVTYPEAVEAALSWGWIDGQKQRGDEASWLQKFTPRSARSIWSQINREKALAMIADGRMHPPGLVEVERAKQDGRWEAAYEPASRAKVPDDLAAALAENTRASAFFGKLDAANRYAVLFRVHTAKKPETRTKRITQLVEMLAREERIHER
ncbi:putative periplasmic membrane protein [Minicystis rosea]|nr:putative periplasmic membrane protein [Minicystis rosea]